MTRKRPSAYKGSEKWLQLAANDSRELLYYAVAPWLNPKPSAIEWLSPLREDEFTEYSDRKFIDHLGARLENYPLNEFWPKRGPEWDALAKTDNCQILLFEAKSYIKEMAGHNRRCQAKPKSHRIIENTFNIVKNGLGVSPDSDWLGDHYQYANRLAHLYLLRVLNDLPAYLIMLYFLNDVEQGGPETDVEWREAIAEEEEVLGIRPGHKLSDFVVPVFIDVNHIAGRK